MATYDDDLQPGERVQVLGAFGPTAPPDGTEGTVVSKMDDGRYVVMFDNPDPMTADGGEFPRAHLRRLAEKVWAEWAAIAEDNPSPVKSIARKLDLDPAYVAAIVYPPDTFGEWSDDQEPDLPPAGLRVVE
jgi:hypothetical protein